MDLSNVPTEDLQAIAAGDMSRVSEPTLRYLSGQPQQPATMAPDVSPAKVAAKKSSIMPALTMQDVRSKFPQYSDMSDQDLAAALHQKFYSDMPFDQFSQKIGYKYQAPDMTPDVSPAKVAAQTVGKNLAGLGEIAGSSIANIPYGVGHVLADLYHRVTGKGYQPDPALVRALHVGTGQAGQEFGPSVAYQLERLSDRLGVGDAIARTDAATDRAATNFEQNHPTLAHTVIPAAADLATLAGARGIPGAVAGAARATGEGLTGARALASGEGFDVGTEEPTAADVGLKAPNESLASHQSTGNVIAANEAGLPPGWRTESGERRGCAGRA